MPQQEELATPDDVIHFVNEVPDELVPCRADHHPFPENPQTVTAYTAAGRETKNYAKAAALDITEACPACGLLRHHTWSLRTRTGSGYTYSNQNPLLVAPRGVWDTGISVRAQLKGRKWETFCANGGKMPKAAPKRRSGKAA